MRVAIFFIALFISLSVNAQSLEEAFGYKSTGGTTATLNSLPAGLKTGLLTLDTSLGKLVFWNGTTFVEVGGGINDGDYGDISISSGVWSIDASAVTSSKIADGTIAQADVSNGYIDLSSSQNVAGNKTFDGSITKTKTIEPSANQLYWFGSETNIWQILLTDRTAYKAPNGTWWAIDTNVGNDLAIGKPASGANGAFTSLYTFNSSGNAVNPTDLIDKSYADANYTGVSDGAVTNAKLAADAVTSDKILDESIGFGDLNIPDVPTNNAWITFEVGQPGSLQTVPRTATNLPYDNTASGLAASNVKTAIDELAASGGGGTAAATTFDNVATGYAATNVQDALEEGQVRKITQAAFDALSQADKDAFTGVITDATGNAIDASNIGTALTAINYTNTANNVETALEGVDIALGDYNELNWIPVIANDTLLPSNAGAIHYNVSANDYELTMRTEANSPHGRDVVYSFLKESTGLIKLLPETGSNFPQIQLDSSNVVLNVARRGANSWIILTPKTYWTDWAGVTNPNPQMNTNNASGYDAENANSVPANGGSNNESSPLGATLASVVSSGHGHGSYALEVTSTDDGSGDRNRHYWDLVNGEIYEYRISKRMTQGTSGRWRFNIGASDTSSRYFSNTAWDEEVGEFTATGTLLLLEIWAANTGVVGDKVEYVFSLKLKND